MNNVRTREPAHVSVFIADAALLNGPRAQDEFIGGLNPGQRAELTTIASPKRHRQFLVSRVLVRAALRDWAGARADSWAVVADADGRPYVRAQTTDPLPGVSLSHSGNCVVCALSTAAQVGVDVEQVGPRDIDRLGEEVLADSEREQLAGGDQSARHQRFYQFWTLKEAYGKALGTGLATPPRDLVFNLSNPERSGVYARPGDVAQFLSFIPTSGMVAAVVLFVPDRGVRPTIRFQCLTAANRVQAVDIATLQGTF